jgi:Flp pilus assembly protein TadD
LLAPKRNAEAVICFDRAIALRPEDWGAWNNKGIALYFMEQFAAALPVLEEAQRLGATRCASMIAVCRDKLGRR